MCSAFRLWNPVAVKYCLDLFRLKIFANSHFRSKCQAPVVSDQIELATESASRVAQSMILRAFDVLEKPFLEYKLLLGNPKLRNCRYTINPSWSCHVGLNEPAALVEFCRKIGDFTGFSNTHKPSAMTQKVWGSLAKGHQCEGSIRYRWALAAVLRSFNSWLRFVLSKWIGLNYLPDKYQFMNWTGNTRESTVQNVDINHSHLYLDSVPLSIKFRLTRPLITYSWH